MSARLCVTLTTTRRAPPSARDRAWSSFMISCALPGSRPLVTSSQSSSEGEETVSMASDSRRRWPPLSTRACRSASASRPTVCSSASTRLGAFVGVGAVHAQARGVIHAFAHGEEVVREAELRHVAEFGRGEVAFGGEVAAVPAHDALGRVGQAGDDLEQGRFAAARRADDADELAAAHLQRHGYRATGASSSPSPISSVISSSDSTEREHRPEVTRKGKEQKVERWFREHRDCTSRVRPIAPRSASCTVGHVPVCERRLRPSGRGSATSRPKRSQVATAHAGVANTALLLPPFSLAPSSALQLSIPCLSAAPLHPPTPRIPPAARSRRPFLLLALPVFAGRGGGGVVLRARLGLRFLRSDDFRHFLDRKASAALRADGHFQPLHWQDTEVYTDAFDATGNPASPFARSPSNRCAPGSICTPCGIASGASKASTRKNSTPPSAACTRRCPTPRPPRRSGPPPRPTKGRRTASWRDWLPGRVEIGAVRDQRFFPPLGFRPGDGHAPPARPRDGGPQNWEIDGTGGRLEETHFPAVRLTSFNVKSSAHEIFLTRAEGQSETRRPRRSLRPSGPRRRPRARPHREFRRPARSGIFCRQTGARACTATPPAAST